MDQEHLSPYYQWPFYYPPNYYQSPNPAPPAPYDPNFKFQNWELEKEDLNKKISSLEECVQRLQRQLALEIEKNQDQETDRVERKKKRK